MKYELLLLIFLIQFSLASLDFLRNCQNKNLFNYSILLLHHLLDVYVFFGIFVTETRNERIIHLITILLIMIHWFTNNYECWLTTYLNELCNEPKNKWLYSLSYLGHKLSGLYYFHSYLIGLIILKNILIH